MNKSSRAHLDALRLTAALRDRLVDFAIDNHYTRDARLTAICRAIWRGDPKNGGLLSELWVEGAFPAESSEQTLTELAGDGLFQTDLAEHLAKVGAMPHDRRLYTHQRDAVVAARNQDAKGNRPALVVTAGTGAGKTECFLLPLLDELFRRQNSENQGIRCLILYPMNALVNDQVDRLYEWLKGQDRVTLFHFTSETPEDARAANKAGMPRWEACPMRTRQEARGLETHDGDKVEKGTVGPQPDILITNYSMLEYMLCRPQDGVFFGPSLRAVVLDEAHLYNGTLAAEITLLLRRLYVRCGVDPNRVLQIATSATLQGGSDDLRHFAAVLFSKDEKHVRVIEGRKARTNLPDRREPADPPTASAVAGVNWLDRPLLVADTDGQFDLADDAELCQRLRAVLPLLTGAVPVATETRPALLLHETLGHAPLIHRLQEVFWDHLHLRLADLARELWGPTATDAEKATVALLQLAASARLRPADYPLVPHRLHLLVRPASGLVVCLDPSCKGAVEKYLPPFGTVSAGGGDCCPQCGRGVLSLYRCMNCGEWLLAGERDHHKNRYRPVKREASVPDLLTWRTDGQSPVLMLAPDGSRGGDGEAGVRVVRVESCPNCGERRSGLRPFASTSPLALAILAESVLAELPEYPSTRKAFLPARGRRLLAFSDSRQEAARLGPQLTHQHETQLVRAALASILTRELAAGPAALNFLRKKCQEYKDQLQGELPPDLRQMIEDELQTVERKLTAAEQGGELPMWEKHLAKEPRLAEILDADTGQRHQARRETRKGVVEDWGGVDWERNREAVQKKALMYLAEEFAALSTRTISAEKLGLAEITYPGLADLPVPATLLGELPAEKIREQLRLVWPAVLEGLCDTLRIEGSLTLGDRQADGDFPSGGAPVGQWCAKREGGPFLNRFLGVEPEHRRRAFAAAVLRHGGAAADRADDLGKTLLETAFDQLIANAHKSGQDPAGGQLPWLERMEGKQTKAGSPVPAIRLVFPRLGLRRPPKLFQCERTGHVWPRSVLGCAPERGCDGTLQPIGDKELDQHPRLGRLRKEYLTSLVFQLGVWAEEHSAQLSPRENRRLQDLFKAGIRNVLSATTTLELGIDIGGLTAVLMSNVPPGKANYLQRAGRAGRRADGSSAVLTFARPRPFDRAVFADFDAYLNQPLRRPLIFLDRQRVVRRHLNAYLLGEFFRALYGPDDRKGAMNAFGDMGFFRGKLKVPYWEDKDTPPALPNASLDLSECFLDELREHRDGEHAAHEQAIARLLRGTDLEERAADFVGLMNGAIEQFQKAIDDWNEDYEQLVAAWQEAVKAEAKAQANAIRYQLKLLWELTVIEALADRQFLPRYGFPIGLQKLRVIAADAKDREKVREEDQYRLERPGLLALGEYVPGSQLLVGGKLITSRGLLKSWLGVSLDNSPGLRGRYCRCVKGHDYYWIADPLEECPICGSPPNRNPLDILLVKHGFTSAAWDPPRWSTDVERVGRAETMTVTFRPGASNGCIEPRETFGGVPGLTARYREDGELLVFNRGAEGNGFAICLKCGYADSELRGRGKGQMGLPADFEAHAAVTTPEPWKTCWKKSDRQPPVLRRQILAARETTDVLLLDFSACLGRTAADPSLIGTLTFALHRAATKRLELDSREIGILLVPTGEDGATFGAVLFDNVPGGAGHVRELLVDDVALLDEARRVLYLDEDHDKRCESACLDCLLSFDAQRFMERWSFARREALRTLDGLLQLRSCE